MKIINKLPVLGFYICNLVLIIFYLYPGNILGCLLYSDCHIQPQITRDIMFFSNYFIDSNHFFSFIILSALGFFIYRNTKTIKFLIIYLFLLSIILELLQIIIPVRTFEWKDLFGNIMGIILVIIIYKIKDKYVKN